MYTLYRYKINYVIITNKILVRWPLASSKLMQSNLIITNESSHSSGILQLSKALLITGPRRSNMSSKGAADK